MPEARKAGLTARVDQWVADGKASPLHFEPSLSAGERKFVHALCESRGSELSSKSEGKGPHRHVVVFDVPVAAGTVGGVSAARRAELSARVDAWIPDKAQSSGLHFEPTLTTAEREFVHQLAAAPHVEPRSPAGADMPVQSPTCVLVSRGLG